MKPLWALFLTALATVRQEKEAAKTDLLDSEFTHEVRRVFESFCFKCHGAKARKGDLNLEKFKEEADLHREPQTLKRIIHQLKDREMPPEGKPQPTLEARDRLAHWLERSLQRIEGIKDPGRVLLRRLNRTEYNYTIRDLLGVQGRPADKFPADGSGGEGFDNTADTLYVPPLLMERYLDAAGEILSQADPKRLFPVQGNTRVNLEHFMMRAFRRPVEPAEVDRYLAFAERHDARSAFKAVLVSPHFLFRVERDRPAHEPYRVGDYELANRLSYFLWSSMPDDELFRLAAEKKLHEPKVLEAQVRRMITDPKSKGFAESFAGQWLGVRGLDQAQPDPKKYPSFTPSLREAMIAEPIEFFHSILRDNGSLLDLVHSDYTFANEELARHYGISGVHGRLMRRVKLTDPNRGGVLGMAGVLTLTSQPQRTSPVVRGKWILEEILGAPPPPPPPTQIPDLPENDIPIKGLSLRQQLEQHRKNAACANCHRRIDPLGFGLENFDPIGRWRTEIAGRPVDASGVLPTGETFTGPAELKKLLVERKDEFTRTLAEKMLSYALGRGLEFYDVPSVRQIGAAVSKDGYRSGTLLAEVVKSYPFLYRRNNPIREAMK